jgi:hypothetical protein
MRLLRDSESGRLIVEIAGQRYTRLADIADKKVGQYILQLVGQLLAFTNGMYTAEAGIKSTPAPKASNVPLPLAAPDSSSLPAALTPTTPVAPQPVPPPAPKIETAYPVSSPALAFTPEPEPAQRRGLFGRSKPAKEPITAPLNLAEQINQIAQTNLSHSPLAATTKLEIQSDPAGGIQIKVNGQVYHSPDDIPDPEVRTLIKDSIKQWEKS